MARPFASTSVGREGDGVRAEPVRTLQKRRDLVRKASDNPPIAFSRFTGKTELTPADWQLDWRVAYCFPRQEKLFATQLWKLGITFLFPMVERELFSGGRRRRSLIPVFPSYVFFAGDVETRLAAQKTNRICSLIEPSPAAQPKLRQELRAIEAALRASPDSMSFHDHNGSGPNVTVSDGPLAGIEGVLIDKEDGRKLWLGISAIGGGIVIDMPVSSIGLASRPSQGDS